MSQATAISGSGDVNYADQNAARTNWVLIGGVVLLALVFLLVKGKS